MQTRTTTTILTAVLLLAAAILPLSAAAHNCEVPLFVQQGSVDANVMVLFDNSGSMNSAMYHRDYDASVVYDGPFSLTRTYYVYWDGDYAPRNVSGRPGDANQASPEVRLVMSYNQNGRYKGNYLNWIFYHATDEQRADIPQQTRMHVAHAVVTDIIERSTRVRFGLAIFNSSSFGRIVASCGTDTEELVTRVNSIQGNSWTPLGEAMETVLNYFKGNDSPIMAECQMSFCIVITDGYPTKDREVSGYLWDHDNDGNDPGSCESIGSPDPDYYECSDHLDDVAHYMFTEDMSSDFEDDQNVVTYTIGFGVDARILQDTADNGDGLYFLAEDAVDLWTSLELVILDIINRISAGSAVAVVSTERGDDEHLYRGKFMPGSWHGFLDSFTLPYEDGDAAEWEAGYKLATRAPSSRSIIAGVGLQDIMFNAGNAAQLMGPMGVADISDAIDVIEWTRGEDVSGYRYRGGWVLGDIIHSTPVVVGAPANFIDDVSYQEFMTTHENRTKMVYVGANDGQLHAFFAESGTESGSEAWSFIPEFALPKLAGIADTTYCHTYTVDGTPSVRDCKVNGSWRTVLVGGGREGGAGYFALDITDPYWPEILWQVELPHGKAFSSMAEFAVIGGEYFVIIGSGLDHTDGRAALEVYAVDDGAHLGTMPLSEDNSSRNRATRACAVDLELDGSYDVCYVADLQGHLWKVDFHDSDNPCNWTKDCLWVTDTEISAPPIAAYGETNEVFVYLGTGAYLESDDIPTRDDHVFACVIDRQDGAEYANLIDQTDTIHDISGEDGWYIRLEEAAGERVTEPAAVVAGAAFFTSFVPSSELCSAGGHSWLYRVDFQDGSVPDDGEDDEWNGERAIALGDGVASRPVVDVVNETVIVQSSDATITVEDIGQAYFHLTVRAWQENFDYVNVPPQNDD